MVLLTDTLARRLAIPGLRIDQVCDKGHFGRPQHWKIEPGLTRNGGSYKDMVAGTSV